jgi:hypothetical protein
MGDIDRALLPQISSQSDHIRAALCTVSENELDLAGRVRGGVPASPRVRLH